MALGAFEAPDNVLPGVIGGSSRVAAGLALKYGGRVAKRLGRYVFKPGKPTLSKAVRRGTGLGILGGLAGDFNEEGEVISPPKIPIRKAPYRFQQRNRRRSIPDCSRRRNYRHDCC